MIPFSWESFCLENTDIFSFDELACFKKHKKKQRFLLKKVERAKELPLRVEPLFVKTKPLIPWMTRQFWPLLFNLFLELNGIERSSNGQNEQKSVATLPLLLFDPPTYVWQLSSNRKGVRLNRLMNLVAKITGKLIIAHPSVFGK